ncbi:MAG: hypothetical protein ABL908_10120 [Hyphomicrobium sp.]
MPKHATPKSATNKSATRTDLQCIRIDAQGYDSSGAYWGAGPDVYIATFAEGAEEITVRATSRSEARTKIDTERKRPPGIPPATREKLGGKASSKTRYEIDWRDAAGGSCVRVRITHSRDYLSMGHDHIEVDSIRPKKAPLPITDTGYRSHFLNPLELANNGGPVTFVTAWLDREAKNPVWRKTQSQRAQGDLFQWAAAQAQTTQPSPSTQRKPKLPSVRPRPRVSRKDNAP